MLPEPNAAVGAELGAVEYVKPGVYVAMLGYGWPRTMLAYTAPGPTGPFTRSPKNVDFLNGACYYSRVSKNDDFCIKSEELCIKNEEFRIKDDEFCSSSAGRCRSKSS